MRIPEIRKEMDFLIADMEMALRRMKVLREELVRRPPVSRAPTKSRPVTASIANQIVTYRAAHPNDTQQEIANYFGVNPGRVSEVLAGFRT